MSSSYSCTCSNDSGVENVCYSSGTGSGVENVYFTLKCSSKNLSQHRLRLSNSTAEFSPESRRNSLRSSNNGLIANCFPNKVKIKIFKIVFQVA